MWNLIPILIVQISQYLSYYPAAGLPVGSLPPATTVTFKAWVHPACVNQDSFHLYHANKLGRQVLLIVEANDPAGCGNGPLELRQFSIEDNDLRIPEDATHPNLRAEEPLYLLNPLLRPEGKTMALTGAYFSAEPLEPVLIDKLDDAGNGKLTLEARVVSPGCLHDEDFTTELSDEPDRIGLKLVRIKDVPPPCQRQKRKLEPIKEEFSLPAGAEPGKPIVLENPIYTEVWDITSASMQE